MNNISISSDYNQILQIFKQNNISSLWHFTDIRNLPLIKKLNGLMSKQNLEKNGYLKNIICGGNHISHQLDKGLGNWDKISLCFTPYTPMAFHKKKESHLIFIEINPLVATFKGVYFTDCNAASRKQNREEGIKGLSLVQFNIINSIPKPYDKDWKDYVQAEILVPDYISFEHFKKIHFISEASLKLGEYLWSSRNPIFQITPKVFADYYMNNWTIINPYLKKVIITDNKESTLDVGNIIREKNFWIKIYLFATAGVKGNLMIKDSNNNIIKAGRIEFAKQDNWLWYNDFQIPAKYSYNEIIFEITLDEILWYKEKRKVLK